jgi:hypothetical protein
MSPTKGRQAAIPAYVEVGAKRAFAGAIEWPGWCRSGRDEAAALGALAAYTPRYARALRGSRLGFGSSDVTFRVVERLKGGSSTDFGVPGEALAADAAPVDELELRRFGTLLRACWRTFDGAVETGTGRRLATGPRGGGRSLDKIVGHVAEADLAYLGALGWKPGEGGERDDLDRVRRAIVDGLTASARGEIPARGPRGGVRWTARYFVRRSAWHVLDHAWEIVDRLT